MGAVKFDLHKESIPFLDFGTVTYDEIYDFLFNIDIIYNYHVNGNITATCIYLDFKNLMTMMNDNSYIEMIHNIIIGKTPYTNKDRDLSVIEVAAKRIGNSPEDFEQRLSTNIFEMQQIGREVWLQWVNQCYHNCDFGIESKKTKKHNFLLNDKKLRELDFLRKYSYNKRIYNKEQLPKSIQDLYDYRETILNNIDTNKKMAKKYHKKDNERYKKYNKEIKRLVNIKIGVDKDIGILKTHYNIPIGKQNGSGRIVNISYNPNDGHIIQQQERRLEKAIEMQNEALIDEFHVGKLQKIAKNILTIRQYIIFEMYYINGMTQQEIADVLGVSQQAIDKSVSKAIKKIKSEI